MRRAAGVLAAFVVAAAAVVGLLAFLSSRDSAPVSRTVRGPGREFPDQGSARLAPGRRPPRLYDSDPPTSGAHVPTAVAHDATRLSDDQVLTALAAGNVVLFYGSPRPPAPLRSLADSVAGPFDPALAQAGQAVILAMRPGTRGIIGAAWRRLLQVASPTDPSLRAFVEAWLDVGRR